MLRSLAPQATLLALAITAGWLLLAAAAGDGAPSTTVTPSPSTSVTPSPSTTASATWNPAYLPFLVQAQPTASPTVTATATLEAAPWLRYVNKFREAADLLPLTERSEWSTGAWLHSRYMVKEDHISHSENATSPWYTEEGNLAGRNGNIYVTSWSAAPDEQAIRFWMAGPFHAVAMLDPQLYETAFGSYREDHGYWTMGATLDWARGLGELPEGTTFPIIFPLPDGETWITHHPGYEFPDPLTSCPGYSAPSGPPLIVQLGSGDLTPDVTAHSFKAEDGTELAHCVFDETSYSNPSASMEYSGRRILNSRDAVVMMPRQPLAVGKHYTASITANDVTHTWQFGVTSDPGSLYTIPEGVDHLVMPALFP